MSTRGDANLPTAADEVTEQFGRYRRNRSPSELAALESALQQLEFVVKRPMTKTEGQFDAEIRELAEEFFGHVTGHSELDIINHLELLHLTTPPAQLRRRLKHLRDAVREDAKDLGL